MIDTLQNALKELYVSLGGSATAVRDEQDINDLIRAIAALGVGAEIKAAVELPAFPTDDGDYSLKLTISDGAATLTWEAVEAGEE